MSYYPLGGMDWDIEPDMYNMPGGAYPMVDHCNPYSTFAYEWPEEHDYLQRHPTGMHPERFDPYEPFGVLYLNSGERGGGTYTSIDRPFYLDTDGHLHDEELFESERDWLDQIDVPEHARWNRSRWNRSRRDRGLRDAANPYDDDLAGTQPGWIAPYGGDFGVLNPNDLTVPLNVRGRYQQLPRAYYLDDDYHARGDWPRPPHGRAYMPNRDAFVTDRDYMAMDAPGWEDW